MTTPSKATPEPSLDAPVPAPAPLSATRPLYWSVRREVWENRSIYVAPLAAAAVILFAFAIRTITLPRRMRALAALDAAQQHSAIAMPYSMAAVLIIFTTFVVGIFYCLDALYGERRDRSILFWKSLPVSDRTAVLSKVIIPLAVLPALAFVIIVPTQLAMRLLATVRLVVSGLGAESPWTHFPLVRESVILLYGLIVHALWHSPIYAWLLLVSAWARRTPFLWAVLPPIAVGVTERIALGTSHFGRFIGYRVMGAMREAFTAEVQKSDGMVERLAQLDPLKFLGSAGLWSGLAVAAGFLAIAVRLRRNREPI